MQPPEILLSPKIPQTETKIVLRAGGAPKPRDQKSAEKVQLKYSKSSSAVKL